MFHSTCRAIGTKEPRAAGPILADEKWRWHRWLPVRVDADKADASFENGVLTLRLPKVPEVRPKTIQVQPKGVLKGETS